MLNIKDASLINSPQYFISPLPKCLSSTGSMYKHVGRRGMNTFLHNEKKDEYYQSLTTDAILIKHL